MSNNVTNVTLPILPILGIIFIVLKLIGIISWSWWWVTAPFWGPLAVVGVIWCSILLFGLLAIILSGILK